MYCENCGTRLDQDAMFCPNCGEQIADKNYAAQTHQTQLNYAPLVIGAKEGSQDAFSKLYEETYQAVYYTAKGILHDDDITMDIVQDAYVKAWQRLDQLEDPNRFPAWIKRIAANGAKDYLKKKKESLFSQYEDEDGNVHLDMEDDRLEYQPEVTVDKAETRRLVEEILYDLPDEQRICTMMYYFDEMKIREIADDLGVSENTVKSRLNYSKKKIKEAVLDLEKKGTKLYGLAPLPFFLWLLRESATEAPVKPFAELWKLITNLHLEPASKLAAEPVSRISSEPNSSLEAIAKPKGKSSLKESPGSGAKSAVKGKPGLIGHLTGSGLTVKITVTIIVGFIIGGLITGIITWKNIENDKHPISQEEGSDDKDGDKGTGKSGEKGKNQEFDVTTLEFDDLRNKAISITLYKNDPSMMTGAAGKFVADIEREGIVAIKQHDLDRDGEDEVLLITVGPGGVENINGYTQNYTVNTFLHVYEQMNGKWQESAVEEIKIVEGCDCLFRNDYFIDKNNLIYAEYNGVVFAADGGGYTLRQWKYNGSDIVENRISSGNACGIQFQTAYMHDVSDVLFGGKGEQGEATDFAKLGFKVEKLDQKTGIMDQDDSVEKVCRLFMEYDEEKIRNAELKLTSVQADSVLMTSVIKTASYD